MTKSKAMLGDINLGCNNMGVGYNNNVQFKFFHVCILISND